MPESSNRDNQNNQYQHNKNKALVFKDVTKVLTDEAIPVTLIKNMSFEIGKGEFVSVIGPSGSGKSSLMYLMGLLDSPTSGEIFVNGIDINNVSERIKERIRLEKLGFIFQFHFLIEEFTVLDNILLPMRRLGDLDFKAQLERVEILLDHFGLLEEDVVNKFPWQLSGGQRQRVAVARAMANNPDIILADEPTGNLDTKNAEIVFNLFKYLVEEEGKTVITITHDMGLAKKTHRQIKIVDGELRS